MSKAKEARTSGLQWDGGIPLVVNSPEMSLSTAASDQGKFTAPCDGTIVKVMANLVQAPGTAAAKLQIGADGSKTSIGEHTFATTDSTGPVDVTDSMTDLSVSAGDVIEFGTDGAATSTGLVAATLVIMPN